MKSINSLKAGTELHLNCPNEEDALSSFSLCTYNISSLLSNDHISALNDLIETHPKIIALTETWINKSSTPSELAKATPSAYTLPSYPRTTKKNTSMTKPWGVELRSSFLIRFL